LRFAQWAKADKCAENAAIGFPGSEVAAGTRISHFANDFAATIRANM